MTLHQDDKCTCKFMLSEVHYTIILDQKLNYINDVYIDIVLLDQVFGYCKSKRYFDFVSSVTYSASLNVSLENK